jgi:hypothetical protein
MKERGSESHLKKASNGDNDAEAGMWHRYAVAVKLDPTLCEVLKSLPLREDLNHIEWADRMSQWQDELRERSL